MKLIAFVGVVGFGAMTGGAAPDAVTFYEAGKTVGARIVRETPSALAVRGRVPKADNTLVITGSWDLSECGTIEAVFAEPAPERVRCTVMLENAGAVTPDPQGYHSEGTFRANLGLQAASNVTEVPIPPAMPDLQASVARLHMLPFLEIFAQVWPHPYWGREMDVSRYGTCFDCWTLDVAKPVVKVSFTWKGDGKLRRLVARGPKNVVQDVPAFAKVKPDDFLPLIDRYGQFKHKEWPGKIHSDADLKRALAAEDADLAAHPGPASFDKWGGWKDGPKQEAKGRFYIKKLNGMWWFVDPDGNLWWSNGPLRVSPSTAMTPYKGRENHFEWLPPEDGDPFSLFYRTRDELMWPYWVKRGITNSFDFSAANIYRKYGADWREKWAARAHRRLRSWGANTIGNSSDRKVVEMSKTPYVERFEIKSLPIRGGDQNFGWWPLRDPYDASFAANVRQQLRERRYQLDDPWCVGFFVDNELPWGFEGHVGRLVWDSPEDQPAKRVFRRWLAERHGSVPATPSDEDFKAFSRVVPGEYFRQIRLAFDEVAPKKLYLGCRGMALEYIAKAAEPYVDAMSQNWYDRDVSRFFFTPPDDPNIGCAGLAAVDKPIVIGEFHMGARDRGPFWGSIVTLRDQNERAAVYRQYLTSALEHPRFIGAHWHHFSDEPTSGRFDGEAMQNGWTDVCDTPYPETIAAVRWVGENMYRIRWEAGLRNMSKERLVASTDLPGDFRCEIVAKGPGKLCVRFERHVDGKVIPVYGAGANFVLSGREKTCTAEHTVPAGAWDALVLTGENIEVSSVKVAPLERREAPELMRTADGRPVKDLATWEKTRRREIRELFENEIYGRRPAERPARLSFAAAEPDRVMMDGKAVRKRIRVSYGDRCGDSSFVVTAFVPSAATREKPAPAFLLICNRDPKKNLDPERQVKSGFWPAEQIVDRGYAAVAFFNGDVTTDARWDFTNGVYGVFQKAGERTTEDWGILSAWAWGASRVMDWIETEPTLDAKHVAVVGHSRGGKTSLLAGVTDARFAMACVNDSGCGGAKLNHWNLPLSEHYVQIHGVNCWFCGNFSKYPNREQEVNFDAHWWMALMAPRLLAVASATEDAWAGQEGEFQAARLAPPAWELYGQKGLVGPGYSEAEKPLQEGSVSYHLRVGKHDLTPYDWDRYMDFADKKGWRK